MEETVKLSRKRITMIIIGSGNRGQVYTQYALEKPDLCKVVGIAEPRDVTRELMVNKHNIPPQNVFKDWKDLAKVEEKLADVAIICTQDQMHLEPAIHFANKGYHILLEKPMAVKEEDCKAIVEAVERNKVIFCVGHVLRYTPYSLKIRELVRSGAIGKIVNIQHVEPVGWYHQAHSYVRGNWRNTKLSSPMLLAKSCHDIDWINWMVGSKCTKVSSFGSLKHFKQSEKPAAAGNATRCLDCAFEPECAYSAKKIYLEPIQETGYKGWPIKIVAEIPTVESVTEALKNGPYGRCVYECDNDVVDNQVVNMQFSCGATASFTMIAFSKEICIRKTRIYGTKGEIEGDGHTITHFDFLTRKSESFAPDDDFKIETQLTGHGGADYHLMSSFVEAVSLNDPSKILSNADETLRSHLIVFEAEKSRLENSVRDLSW
eukprot:TRINITY_DN7203_c0_g1_i1.p1 TRINITY_DN7203_c0_g1~~TRINITY_DN7203_c0_g1_i1.p1  ORF type:complete len:443 (-),score=68.08 TRINITY_DN7203_c0_g1_i1:26-1321(-)